MTRRGLNMVFTGSGKGKTTAALGLGLRAWGQGMKVLVLQFMKSESWPTGELKAARLLHGFDIRPMGAGFLRYDKPDELERHRKAAEEALAAAREALQRKEYDMVILDEICVALQKNLVTTGDVLDLMTLKGTQQHLVLTGRGAPEEIKARADLVTEMREIKHPYPTVEAQPGIEY
ncbi:MAG: cob(I)yrinic acid a,c-diamide adenosyltransferase [Peptococcaceae bacterium]|nr:cob(I)yrinic acid a,c-diamide adenosyltransferase [Peptococcaceae bacterium]